MLDFLLFGLVLPFGVAWNFKTLVLVASLLISFVTACPPSPPPLVPHGPQWPIPLPPPSSPKPPQLQWLFTADLDVLPNSAPVLPGPHGIRLNLPIVGGKFRGIGGLNGTIKGNSADWALLDPTTGIGSADARWIISLPATHSTGGLDSLVFVSSTGPSQKRGGLNRAHLRLVFETGGPEYYWMNNILAVGVLEILNPSNTSVQDVHIDAFNASSFFSLPSSIPSAPVPTASDSRKASELVPAIPQRS
ncbi:hypothetical protein JCM10212_005007 [Sporobolomyces blumeae]